VLWSAIVVYIALVFFVFQWSGYAGLVLLLAGAVVWFVLMKNRNQLRGTRLSTICERCDAPLAEHAGMPVGTCLACGHVQSWADKKGSQICVAATHNDDGRKSRKKLGGALPRVRRGRRFVSHVTSQSPLYFVAMKSLEIAIHELHTVGYSARLTESGTGGGRAKGEDL
jgi:hypothetical protein